MNTSYQVVERKGVFRASVSEVVSASNAKSAMLQIAMSRGVVRPVVVKLTKSGFVIKCAESGGVMKFDVNSAHRRIDPLVV